MKTLRRLAAVAALTLAPAVALAASAQEQLRAFVATVSSATGSFSQYTVNNQGRTQPAQTGVFSFQRPGKFKWAVQKPYEQLVVSDGRKVSQFDPDLAQVTERKVDAAIGTFIEYGTTNRDKNKESYAEMWHRWIFEDYYRN